jgi:hypothetical protein
VVAVFVLNQMSIFELQSAHFSKGAFYFYNWRSLQSAAPYSYSLQGSFPLIYICIGQLFPLLAQESLIPITLKLKSILKQSITISHRHHDEVSVPKQRFIMLCSRRGGPVLLWPLVCTSLVHTCSG